MNTPSFSDSSSTYRSPENPATSESLNAPIESATSLTNDCASAINGGGGKGKSIQSIGIPAYLPKLTSKLFTHAVPILIAATLVLSPWLFGRSLIPSTWNRMNGIDDEPISFDHSVKEIGLVDRDSTKMIEFPIENRTSQVVKILGVRSSCSCAVSENLDDSIAPNGKITVQVRFNPSNYRESEEVNAGVVIYTDRKGAGEIPLNFHAKIAAGDPNAL